MRRFSPAGRRHRTGAATPNGDRAPTAGRGETHVPSATTVARGGMGVSSWRLGLAARRLGTRGPLEGQLHPEVDRILGRASAAKREPLVVGVGLHVVAQKPVRPGGELASKRG